MEKFVIAVVVVIILVIVIEEVCEKHRIAKRQEALDYLLEVTNKVYFHGRTASKCIQKAAVWELGWHRVGDFSKIFGELVLFALYIHGDKTAWLYWKYRENDNLTGPEHNDAYVNFNYGGKHWALRVRGRDLTEVDFRQANEVPDQGFAICDFSDLPHKDRYLLENCTDPTRSNLAPDFCYLSVTKDDLDCEVERVLEVLNV